MKYSSDFTLYSFAKINLNLFLLNKNKSNGYHEISSIFCKVPIYDTINIVQYNGNFDIIKIISSTNSIEKKYLNNINNNNSIIQSVKIIREIFLQIFDIKIPYFHINVDKKIPILSGLGGGSSNAGSIINYLCDLHFKNTNQEELSLNYKKIIIKLEEFFLKNTTNISQISKELCQTYLKNFAKYNYNDLLLTLKKCIASIIGMDTIFFISSLHQNINSNLLDCSLYQVNNYGDNIKDTFLTLNLFKYYDCFIFIPKNYTKLSTKNIYNKITFNNDINKENIEKGNLQYILEIQKLIENYNIQLEQKNSKNQHKKMRINFYQDNAKYLKSLIHNDFLEIVKNDSTDIKNICDFLGINSITHGLSGSGNAIFALMESKKFELNDFKELQEDFYILHSFNPINNE